MIRQRPSKKLRNTHDDLLLATQSYGRATQERDVPFLQQKESDLQFSLQLAIIERLDAILQMTEHRVVDHICQVEGHDHINEKKKGGAKGKRKPDAGPGDGEVVDDLLDGLTDGGGDGG